MKKVAYIEKTLEIFPDMECDNIIISQWCGEITFLKVTNNRLFFVLSHIQWIYTSTSYRNEDNGTKKKTEIKTFLIIIRAEKKQQIYLRFQRVENKR